MADERLGGYGSMPDIMQMLTQTFTPMQVLDTRPGATPAPTTPTPTTPAPARKAAVKMLSSVCGLLVHWSIGLTMGLAHEHL